MGAIALMFCIAAAALLLAPAPAALAAEYGPGFDDVDNGGFGRIGAYRVDGRNVYCLEPLLDRPLGTTSAAGEANADRFGVSADELAAVNWAISTRGQSDDPVVTSAVALFVWSIVAPDDLATIDGEDDGLLRRVPADRRGAVQSELASLRDEAARLRVGTDDELSGRVEVTADPDDWRAGSVTVHASDPDAVAEVELHGAAFSDAAGGTSARLAAGDSRPIIVDAAPDARAGSAVEVRVSGVLRGAEAWRPAVDTFVTPGAQLLGGGGDPHRPEVPISGSDSRAATFAPVVSTSVERAGIELGEPFVDRWTPDVPGGAWLRDDDGYAEVIATGTLYGPFETMPARASTAPADAPVAAIVSVTLGGGGIDPVGSEVRVSTADLATPVVASRPGYYVWVVAIDAAQQPDPGVLPRGYHWRDEFGIPDETTYVAPPPATTAPPVSTSPATPPDTPAPTPTEPPTPDTDATPTPTESPTPTPTTTTTPPAPSQTTTPSTPPSETSTEPPAAAAPVEPAAPAPPAAPAAPTPPATLAETGAAGGLDWLLVGGAVVMAGACLVVAAMVRRAEARFDERRAAAAR